MLFRISWTCISVLLCWLTTTNGFVLPFSLQSTNKKNSLWRQEGLLSASVVPTKRRNLQAAASSFSTDPTEETKQGSSYIRWNMQSASQSNKAAAVDVWELQTAVTTFQRTNPDTQQQERIELHAQVHYGNQEYFDYFNCPEFLDRHDQVYYELLVDEDLLGLSKENGRVLKERLQASPTDQAVAVDYGWKCQVDVIDYTHPKFQHADFTRQELLQQQQQQQELLKQRPFSMESSTTINRPLWQQVSSSGTAFWQPAVSALLVGPPSLFLTTDPSDASSSTTKRKLFTNLFLPGNQLAGWLRATLWMTVPAPEISVLLLDWSSLFVSQSSAQFSPVTLPILQSFMTLHVSQLRQLVFGQVLVAGNSQQQLPQQNNNQDWNLLVTQRNDHALQVMMSLHAKTTSSSGVTKKSYNVAKRMALLYGCSHCPDLQDKLVRDFGFVPIKTEWRTAWSVSVPKTFAAGTNVKVRDDAAAAAVMESHQSSSQDDSSVWTDLYSFLPPTAWAALVVLFPLYLSVGAVDWIDTIHSSSISLLDNHDTLSFAGEWMLYLLRHVLLYVGVSKFALEWQDPKS